MMCGICCGSGAVSELEYDMEAACTVLSTKGWCQRTQKQV